MPSWPLADSDSDSKGPHWAQGRSRTSLLVNCYWFSGDAANYRRKSRTSNGVDRCWPAGHAHKAFHAITTSTSLVVFKIKFLDGSGLSFPSVVFKRKRSFKHQGDF